MKIKPKSIFHQFQIFEKQIEDLEGKILVLEDRIEKLIQIERNHLLRVKNREELSDDFILQGKRYNDLSPEKAWRLYQNKDFDFILLDVTSKEFKPHLRATEAIHIPWEDLAERFIEIQTRTTPILVISEDGTNSVLACEFLAKRGFFNCNNVSGGYKFWRALRQALGQSA